MVQSDTNITFLAIAAMSENRVIGKGGHLPWRVQGDAQFWRETSRGKPVIMGRRSFEDTPPSFQKRDKIIVVTRDKNWTFAENVTVVHSVEDSVQAAKTICQQTGDTTVVIGGGGEIYKHLLDQTDEIYLTTIHCQVADGDAFFPALDHTQWTQHGADQFFEKQDGDSADYTIRHYKRI